MASNTFFHSVRLDAAKCVGCTNCIKRCPTGAIRVRRGKAQILSERCIDCGECILICPSHAKYAESYPLSELQNYKYKVALPPPELYGQFRNLEDPNRILTALLSLGFDDVFEVAAGAEVVTERMRLYVKEHADKKPLISSDCPAVVRLIRVRFPSLIDHMVNLNPPMEVAAELARARAVEKTGLSPSEIGIFYLSPCTAKISSIKQPICNEKSRIDGVFAIRDIYKPLLAAMEAVDEVKPLQHSGRIGMSWGISGGEAASLLDEKSLAAAGIENIISLLEEIEDEKLEDLDFVELRSCTVGCVAGPLTVENPFVAKARLKAMRKYAQISCNAAAPKALTKEMHWGHPLQEVGILKLDKDIGEAMKKMQRLQGIEKSLPGLDCGTCGAPSCHDLAEDIVRGRASIEDCVFSGKGENGYIPIPVPFRKSKQQK